MWHDDCDVPDMATKATKATFAARKAPPSSARKAAAAPRATLTLSSHNYSSWSLRGWLMTRFAGLEVDEVMVPIDDADARRELLLLAPSILLPCLEHDGAKVWNVMAIGYYLDEIAPQAGLLPADRIARAHCRSVCGEMNSGFANLRSSLPMNLKGRFPGYKVWSRAQTDIDRVLVVALGMLLVALALWLRGVHPQAHWVVDVGLLYLALGSFSETLVILATLPDAFVGGIVALWLAGETWNISSIVGMIGLFGVAVWSWVFGSFFYLAFTVVGLFRAPLDGHDETSRT